jgi:hypothetical protein
MDLCFDTPFYINSGVTEGKGGDIGLIEKQAPKVGWIGWLVDWYFYFLLVQLLEYNFCGLTRLYNYSANSDRASATCAVSR